MDRYRLDVIVLSCALALPPLAADTVELAPEKDNSLFEVEPFNVSNGAGQHLFSGNTVSRGRRRALLAFAIAGSVPAGSTIRSASLTLHMSMTIAGDEETGLHRVTSDWGEGTSDADGPEGGGTEASPGDATWIHTFFDTVLWNEPGGDFAALPSATTPVGDTGFYTWKSPGLVADVQSWLEEPERNFGWIVLGDESEPRTAKRFDSRENSHEERRPRLVVEFTPPAPVPALTRWGCALMVSGLLALGSLLLARRRP